MILLVILAVVAMAGITTWWLARLRTGPVLESPDTAVENAQDPRSPDTNARDTNARDTNARDANRRGR